MIQADSPSAASMSPDQLSPALTCRPNRLVTWPALSWMPGRPSPKAVDQAVKPIWEI